MIVVKKGLDIIAGSFLILTASKGNKLPNNLATKTESNNVEATRPDTCATELNQASE